MNIEWSPFALAQFNNILDEIEKAQSLDVALKWLDKIDSAVDALADFPLIGAPLQPVTHKGFDDFFKGLRQIVVPPYRIVYELKEDVCEVLFCQRTEQMLTPQAQ